MKEDHTILVALPGLNPGKVPIEPVKRKTKMSQGENFQFKQLLMSPAFAVTDYRAQGATEDAIIIDLVPPGTSGVRRSQADQRALVYVGISRATTLEGLAILRDFSAQDLGRDIQEGPLAAQLWREIVMEQQTIAQLRQVHLGHLCICWQRLTHVCKSGSGTSDGWKTLTNIRIRSGHSRIFCILNAQAIGEHLNTGVAGKRVHRACALNRY